MRKDPKSKKKNRSSYDDRQSRKPIPNLIENNYRHRHRDLKPRNREFYKINKKKMKLYLINHKIRNVRLLKDEKDQDLRHRTDKIE